MNKKEFIETRERFSDLKTLIWNDIVQKVNFAQYECSKRNEKIIFHNPFEKKEFPLYYFQIGEAGFLDREELEAFMNATKQLKV